MTTLPNPFAQEETEGESRFVLDVDAFMAAIEPMPAFLENPSPEYLTATELMPIVQVLSAY